MRLQIEQDSDNDQVYLCLAPDVSHERGLVTKTIRATEDVFLDFDSEGRLVGIDILNASRVLAGSFRSTG